MRFEDFRLRVEAVLGVDLVLDPREARALLELAYLAIASDRVLAAAEVEAFQHVASVLRDKAVFSRRGRGDGDPSELVLGEPETFELIGNMARDVGSGPEALEATASRLSRTEVKEAGYRLAFAMTLCDFETSDEELELDDALARALGIEDQRAELLEADVYRHLEE